MEVRNDKSLDWADKKSKQKKVPGVISTAFVANIATRQNEDDFDNDGNLLAKLGSSIDKVKFVVFGENRKERFVSLSVLQHRAVMALSYVMSQGRYTDEDIQTLSEQVTKGGVTKEELCPVIRNVNLKGIAKLMFDSGKKAQVKAVRDSVQQLSNTKQFFNLPNGYVILDPIIEIHGEEVVTPKGDWYVRIKFGNIFFYNLYKNYVAIKEDLFKLSSKRGSGMDTLLSWEMLSKLMALFTLHINLYKNAEGDVKKEHPEEAPEALSKAIKQAQRSALHITLRASKIKSNVVSYDYDKKRENKRFETDMKKACECYKEIGLITEYCHKYDSKKEETIWHFWFNPDYNKQGEMPAMLTNGEE